MFNRLSVRWIKNCLDGHAQKVPHIQKGIVFLKDPILFQIFINDTVGGIGCILDKFAEDTKLSDAVDSLEGTDTI